MSFPKRARISLWNREDISYCNCGESRSVHAHCPCDVCHGKAVARSTEYHHWIATRDLIESQESHEHVEMAMGTDFNEVDFRVDPSTSAHAHLQSVEGSGATDTCTCTVEESTGVVNTSPTQTSEELEEVLTCTSCEETESSLAAQVYTATGTVYI